MITRERNSVFDIYYQKWLQKFFFMTIAEKDFSLSKLTILTFHITISGYSEII